MLLYLNQNTWLEDDGERLAEHVKQAREDKLKIVMAHENDPDLGGCQFSRMFEVTPQERARGVESACSPPPNSPPPNPPTPQELIAGGLYKDLAKSCFPGRHRKARVLSRPFVRIEFRRGASLFAGVARASGKEPRRDPRSVAGGPLFRQHRRGQNQPRGAQLRRPQPGVRREEQPQLFGGARRLWGRGVVGAAAGLIGCEADGTHMLVQRSRMATACWGVRVWMCARADFKRRDSGDAAWLLPPGLVFSACGNTLGRPGGAVRLELAWLDRAETPC